MSFSAEWINLCSKKPQSGFLAENDTPSVFEPCRLSASPSFPKTLIYIWIDHQTRSNKSHVITCLAAGWKLLQSSSWWGEGVHNDHVSCFLSYSSQGLISGNVQNMKLTRSSTTWCADKDPNITQLMRHQITCRVCWVYDARPEQILTSSQSSCTLVSFFLGYLSCFNPPLLTSEYIWQLLKVKLFVVVPHNPKPTLGQGLYQLCMSSVSVRTHESREKSKHCFTLKALHTQPTGSIEWMWLIVSFTKKDNSHKLVVHAGATGQLQFYCCYSACYIDVSQNVIT